MAGENRTAPDLVRHLQALAVQPHRFGLFAALRRIECLSRDRPRLGCSARPSEDPVRLGQEPSLAFAPSTLASFAPGAPGRPARLEVLCFGLFGPNGPLPLHLTEYARDRLRHFADPTFARFADLFHHRLISLFYRAWASGEPAVAFDRPESDRFGDFIGSLCGLGLPSLRGRDAMSDLAKLHFAGRLGCPSRPPEGLLAILRSLLGVPVALQEFVGHWLWLPVAGRCRLGETPVSGTLGVSAVLGERVWDCQHRFRLVLGPLTLAEYRGLLPSGPRIAPLVAAVRSYVGLELAWDVNLVLRAGEVPQARLGTSGRLGWTTWLGRRDPATDAGDLLLDAEAAVVRSAPA